MIEEAQKMITTIRQMEASLYDSRPSRDYQSDADDLKVTFPLSRCLQVLKEKHINVSRAHKERFEQVKSKYPSRPMSINFAYNPTVGFSC